MARPRKFTDKEFTAKYDDSKSMLDLAAKLGVSTVSAYKHCARLDLKPILDTRQDAVAGELYDEYRGNMTIEQLAAQRMFSPGVVRYHIKREIVRRWTEGDKSTSRLPMPTKICQVKLVHELVRDESIYEDPGQLAKLAHVPQLETDNYLQRIFEHRAQLKNRRIQKGRRRIVRK